MKFINTKKRFCGLVEIHSKTILNEDFSRIYPENLGYIYCIRKVDDNINNSFPFINAGIFEETGLVIYEGDVGDGTRIIETEDEIYQVVTNQ